MSSFAQGTTARSDARFTDGVGVLVDPTTPLVDLIDANGLQLVTDAVPVRDSLGLYHYDHALAVAAPLGTWRAHWTGVINGSPVSGDDFFTVVLAGQIGFEGASIVTEARYRAITIDTASPATAITAALIDAQGLVEEYLRRELASAVRTERLVITGDRVYPSAVPITVAPAGATIDGFALSGVASDPAYLFERSQYATVTYTGGFTAATLPKTIERRIALVAYDLLHEGGASQVPAGAVGVSQGDASVSFGPRGSAASHGEYPDIRRWRRKFL